MSENKTIKIEKLIFGGQALGRLGGKVVLCFGALPGEEVSVKIVREKSSYIEAAVEKIISPSKSRVEPKEDHYLCCSPWQILDWQGENIWKKKIALEVFRGIEGVPDENALKIVFKEDSEYHYRNKEEFRFVADKEGKVSLALLERGSNNPVAIKECALAEDRINNSARWILDWINKNAIPAEILKSLVVRSDGAGRVMAALFLREALDLKDLPELNNILVGFHVFHVKKLSETSFQTLPLFASGKNFLLAEIFKARLKFGINSFFQVNLPVFKDAVKDISKFLDRKKLAIDCFAGVGALSIPFAKNSAGFTLIESSEEAARFAEENIDLNRSINCSVIHGAVEENVAHIGPQNIVILDPPRAGLSNKVVAAILNVLPLRLIYLSCDLSSQARDIRKLAEKYRISFFRLYNFFPRTPHIEGLIVLDKKTA